MTNGIPFTYNPGGPNDARYARNIWKRLLSPDEFEDIGSGERMMFNSYMDYVNQFGAQKKRSEKLARQGYGDPGTQRVPQGGVLQIEGALPASKQTIGAKMAKAGTNGIPEYRIHKDIRGGVSYEPVGVETHRGMGGEAIPGSIEDIQARATLKYKYNIPKIEKDIQVESELESLTKQAALAQEKAALKSPKALIAEQQQAVREMKLGFEERKVVISEQREERMKSQYFRSQNWREANAITEREFRRDQFELTAKINQARDKFNADERKELANINNQAALNRAMTILDRKIAVTVNENEKDRLEDVRNIYISMENKLLLMKANESELEFKRNKSNWEAAQAAAMTGMGGTKSNVPQEGEEFIENGVRYKIVNGKKYKWVEGQK